MRRITGHGGGSTRRRFGRLRREKLRAGGGGSQLRFDFPASAGGSLASPPRGTDQGALPTPLVREMGSAPMVHHRLACDPVGRSGVRSGGRSLEPGTWGSGGHAGTPCRRSRGIRASAGVGSGGNRPAFDADASGATGRRRVRHGSHAKRRGLSGRPGVGPVPDPQPPRAVPGRAWSSPPPRSGGRRRPIIRRSGDAEAGLPNRRRKGGRCPGRKTAVPDPLQAPPPSHSPGMTVGTTLRTRSRSSRSRVTRVAP